MRLLRTEQVSLAQIEFAPGWRDDLDLPNVDRLTEQLRAGRMLPPVRLTEMLGLYEVVQGRHRLAAAIDAELEAVRADIVEYASAEEQESDALLENVCRRDLPREERDRGLARLVELRILGYEATDLDSLPPQGAEAPRKTKTAAVRDVAAATGRSERQVERAVEAQAEPKASSRCRRGCKEFSQDSEGVASCVKCGFVDTERYGDAPARHVPIEDRIAESEARIRAELVTVIALHDELNADAHDPRRCLHDASSDLAEAARKLSIGATYIASGRGRLRRADKAPKADGSGESPLTKPPKKGLLNSRRMRIEVDDGAGNVTVVGEDE